MDFYKIISEQTIVINILSSILVLSALTLVLFLLIKKNRHDSLLKVIGVLLVTGICLMANNTWIYTITLFIIATSITTLDFLEKLAAIFMKSDRYWEYRIHERNASELERENKIIEEVTSDTQTSSQAETKTNTGQITLDKNSEAVILAYEFEKEVLATLIDKDKGLFLPDSLETNKVFEEKTYIGRQTPWKRSKVFLDGIANGPWADYVIEVKFTSRKSATFFRAEKQVRHGIELYKKLERAKGKDVKGIIIVPSNIENVPDFVDEMRDIVILKFDFDKKIFTNRDIIRNWVNSPY